MCLKIYILIKKLIIFFSVFDDFNILILKIKKIILINFKIKINFKN